MTEAAFSWTADRVERLKELASTGISSREIAAAIGAPSRNSVIGKAKRLRISIGPKREPAPPKKILARNRKPRTFGTLPFMPPKPVLAVVVDPVVEERTYKADEPLPGSRMLGIMQLRSNSCRWPLGDTRAPDFAYCGADTAIGRSYCPGHHRMAYASQIQPYVKPAPAQKANVLAIFKAAIAAELAGAAP